MSSTDVRTQTTRPDTPAISKEPTARILKVLRGLQSNPADPVRLPVPGLATRRQEAGWQDLLSSTSEEQRLKRQGMIEQIQCFLKLNEKAQTEGKSLNEIAEGAAQATRKALETGWVQILENNRAREAGVRSLALMFQNTGVSRSALKKRVFALNASVREIATPEGSEILAGILKKYVQRPDNRHTRNYILGPGWAGSTEALDRLLKSIQPLHSVYIGDGPRFSSKAELRDAAMEGGILERLAGDEIHKRQAILIGNRVRVRRAFKGRFAKESSDLFVEPSAPWFGGYLDHIVKGDLWIPPVGFKFPIQGVDGVEHDLLLDEEEGFSHFYKHRLNPTILLRDQAGQVVVWGPHTLSSSGDGVQMGVSITENYLILEAERIVNQHAMLQDLGDAEDKVRKILSKFVTDNSGANRMFRAGSRVSVRADHERKSLDILFEIQFREVTERSLIQISKAMDRTKMAEATIN